MKLDLTFEESPWESYIQGLQDDEAIDGEYVLALMESETEEAFEEALQWIEDSDHWLDISNLPKISYSGENGLRLRAEAEFVKKGMRPKDLQETDPLRLYLEELAQIPAAGDPQLLALQCLEGNENAKQLLANVSISRAVAAAQSMTGRGVLLLDLIQEASLGLWEAILRYDGGDFETHADWWITQYLAKAVTMQARQSGVGSKMRKALEHYRTADKELLTKLGRNPTMEEIALEMGISPEEAEVYQDMLRNARTMEKTRQQPAMQEPEDDQSVENTAYFQSRQRILDMLSTLTQQQAQVLTLRFGLEGGQPCTPQEVGAKLNLTADQVVQLEAEALAKLRNQE